MMKETGGIVKLGRKHIIGDDYCSHCIPFPDPDYTLDVGLMHPHILEQPITIDDMTPEEIKKLEEEIRKQVRTKIKIQKFLY